MRPPAVHASAYQAPLLLHDAERLHEQLQRLSVDDLRTHMHLSASKAEQTHGVIQDWSIDQSGSRPAIDAFLGDIYSGLQVRSFSPADRRYANDHLLILSGLYGGLRALDSVHPYRLEMGYRLPLSGHKNLYDFWADKIAGLVPSQTVVINLSAVEYTKAVLPYIKNPVITPKFLTVSPKTGQPTFVTVHAKIARGAFAHWLIKHRVSAIKALSGFTELGYRYDKSASTPDQPVFICHDFKGIGLSVRLS